MAERLAAGAADGFVVKFSHNPGGADDFVDGVVPLLRRRGLLPADYPEGTLVERIRATTPA
jgi:alkanesulfonate monooxygenase SsuD/methylene tetrahydromethanopterin reductase-like flavin-dependent oxidoreductase (luciferase family)